MARSMAMPTQRSKDSMSGLLTPSLQDQSTLTDEIICRMVVAGPLCGSYFYLDYR